VRGEGRRERERGREGGKEGEIGKERRTDLPERREACVEEWPKGSTYVCVSGGG